MATEIVTGIVRAVLKTEDEAASFQSDVFVTKDEDGDYMVTFEGNQGDHNTTEYYQFFTLNGLRELHDFLGDIIDHEEENGK